MIVNDAQEFITSTVSADAISDTLRLPFNCSSLIVEVNGTGEFSVAIETSPNGTDWYSINELDAFSVDTIQSLSDSINLFRYLRAKIDIGTSGSVTVCRVHFKRD